MKKIFWLGCVGLFLFEIANVYFIMPMPGSQRMNSIDTAYFLYKWRWIFRSLFGLMIVAGLFKSNWKRKWIPAIPLLLIAVIAYMANFKMAADAMFKQPSQLQYVTADKSKVDSNRLVIGVVINGEAKAYPIQFLGYHHQVQDVVGGKSVLVTYCTVCRTGRVFEPIFADFQCEYFEALAKKQKAKAMLLRIHFYMDIGKTVGTYQIVRFFRTILAILKTH